MSSEIEIETIPGLPHELPPGERVLWQGRPEWRGLARQAFSVRWLAVYFGVFTFLRLIVALDERRGIAIFFDVASAALLGAACLALFSGMAWLYARSTVYTLTTRRIVFRIGVALPMTWNLPFKQIASADLKVRSDRDGDVMLQLKAPNRVAWLHLWPHVAPWKLARAQPTLRAIAEPTRVASLLRDAVAQWAKAEATPIVLSGPITAEPAKSSDAHGHMEPAEQSAA